MKSVLFGLLRNLPAQRSLARPDGPKFLTVRGAEPALCGLLRNLRKTERGAKQFLIRPAVRAAPFALLIIASLTAAPGKKKFTGAITDSMCALADHSRMKMGPTDAECTIACINEHGAQYVLYDGREVYTLSDQRTPEKFAGKKVTVAGVLDAKTKTIQVESIIAAK